MNKTSYVGWVLVAILVTLFSIGAFRRCSDGISYQNIRECIEVCQPHGGINKITLDKNTCYCKQHNVMKRF